MYNKYFTVDVEPEIAASAQNTEFSSGDVLFDWTPFQVPKGSSALTSATAMVRSKADAGSTANRFGFNLIFSKTNTQSLGVPNAVPLTLPHDEFLGWCEFEDVNYTTGTLKATALATLGRGANSAKANPLLVLEGDPNSGDNVGYDTVYVGAIATGAFNFVSLHKIRATTAARTLINTDAVSNLSLLESFLVGDEVQMATTVSHGDGDASVAADTKLGIIESFSDATNMKLKEVPSVILADGAILHTTKPIKLRLSFEK